MFRHLTIKAQLLALIAFLCVLLAGIGAAGLYGMDKANDALESVYSDRTVPMGQLGQIRYLISQNRLAVATAQVTATPEFVKQQTELVERNIAEITRIWDEYMATRLTDEEKKLAEQFAADRKKFVTQGLQPAVAALRANNLPEVNRIAVEAVRPLYQPVNTSVEALLKLQLDEAKKEHDVAEARYHLFRNIGLSAIAAAILLAFAIGFLLVRGIGRSLAHAMDIADAVAAGDLTTRIEANSNNETGHLLQALKRMNDGLVELVTKVRTGVDTISTGSQEIAAGNSDLSQRTEEQASSLEETASSMEELTSTVKQTAENARQANQLAAGASAVAVKGGEVVGQVVSTMSGISESSKKIVDIIGVIDGIAFQTNILALNAAVEAARAGEQGRGFAVVASEVRTLAQRSAAAAKEIKELITDSVQRVEGGTHLVNDAGKTMEEIVGAVKRVTDIMAEITAASQEQSSGIEQVNQAVMQMDQVTQQNAALVEEAAAAAESMQQQAQTLSQAVAVFKVARGLQPAASASAAGGGSEPKAAVKPIAKAAAERRGAGRARNVARLPEKKVAAPEEPVERAIPAKTGTDDDWNEF